MRALGLKFTAMALGAIALLGFASSAQAHEDESPAAQAEAKKHKGAPRSFKEKPAVGTWATCPVSGETFQVDADTQFAQSGGRTYAFCCPDCKGDFEKNPEKYSTRPKSKT